MAEGDSRRKRGRPCKLVDPDTPRAGFADCLRAVIKRHGTQERFISAVAHGISRSLVSALASGSRAPTQKHMVVLLRGCTPAEASALLTSYFTSELLKIRISYTPTGSMNGCGDLGRFEVSVREKLLEASTNYVARRTEIPAPRKIRISPSI